jgi:hypothetical protein
MTEVKENIFLTKALAGMKEKLEGQMERSIASLLVTKATHERAIKAEQAKIVRIDNLIEALAKAYDEGEFVKTGDITEFVGSFGKEAEDDESEFVRITRTPKGL